MRFAATGILPAKELCIASFNLAQWCLAGTICSRPVNDTNGLALMSDT
jgi:hypothetical protein